VSSRARLALAAALLIFVGVPFALFPARAARAQPVVSQDVASPDTAAGSPRGVLGTDSRTNQRYIRLTGQGYPTVDIACDGRRWTLAQTRSEDGAVYEVARAIVEPMLNAVECRLFLPDQELALTRQQLWAAWAGPARGAEAPQVLVGQVVEVLDGNTILVNLGDRAEAVRYIGISAKETTQATRALEPSRIEPAEANRQLVARQQIRLELDVQERDRDGRLLAYVYVADNMVNAELVRRGTAEVMTAPPNVRHRELFVTLEQEARDQRRGLWADPAEPTTPQQSTAEAPRQTAEGRPGVPPEGLWTCPTAQPIKGNFTPSSGERCVYHVPDGEFYSTTKPERCYATDEDARQDGCRRSKR